MSVPLPDPTGGLVGRDYQMERLRTLLQNGSNAQIIGPRGLGKSALLRAVAQNAPTWDPAFFVGLVDLSDPVCESVGDFWEAVRSAWGGVGVLPKAAGLVPAVEELRRRGRRPVLCLDDFEALTERPRTFTSDFFLDLRSLSTAGAALIVTAGRPLSDLLPSNQPTSPFFSIFQIIRLDPLSPEDASDLLTLQSPGDAPLTLEEKTAVVNFAGGYPLALQVARSHVLVARKTGQTLPAALLAASEEVRAATGETAAG